MELTNELKQKFFALYWGQQCVLREGEDHATYAINHDTMSAMNEFKHIHREAYLQLRPLSSITEEESREVFNISMNDGCTIHVGFETSWTMQTLRVNTTDYLRSRGFALPFMGISVEEMVKAGWIELTE